MSRHVTVGSDRIALVGGQPFFPIAARHLPVDADYGTLREAGFNSVRWTPFGVDRFEGEALRPPDNFAGLKFYAYVYNRGDLAEQTDQRRWELTQLVESVREHPDLLAYEQRNEPATTFRNAARPQSSPEGMIAGSELIRRLDPHHPICVGHACNNLVATLRRYNPAVDIVGCNPYVVLPPQMRQAVGLRSDGRWVDCPDQTLSAVGLHTDKMMRVAEGRAVWMQIQGAANENWYNAGYTPESQDLGLYEYQRLNPNRWQLRLMAYQALIRGATGLTWMLYGLSIHEDAWRDVARVVAELRSLHDVLAGPTWQGALRVDYTELGFSDWNGVQTLVKLHGEKPWILAANSQFDPMIATFSNLPAGIAGELEVVGERRRVRVAAGNFTDRFQPYDVHVYAPVDTSNEGTR